MASIKRRPDGRWRARYRDEAGKEHARHFDRKVDGQRWLDEVTTSMLTGRYVDGTKLAPSTVRVTYQHLRSVFRAAELDRVIGRTPCERIKLPHVPREQVQPLSTDLVLGIGERMPRRWAAMVTLMAGTGLRPGEAAGVTLDRTDFLRRQLVVDRQLLLTRPHTFGEPKTRSSVRTVPMPQVVVDALAAHIAAYPPGEHGLLFTNTRGGMPNRDDMARAFRAAALEAGAPDGTRLHDLRHYYASLLIRHGESVKVVQARLGHASATETLDTYSHLWPDAEDLTRSAVDDVLGAAVADSSRTEEAT
jgi:integrase